MSTIISFDGHVDVRAPIGIHDESRAAPTPAASLLVPTHLRVGRQTHLPQHIGNDFLFVDRVRALVALFQIFENGFALGPHVDVSGLMSAIKSLFVALIPRPLQDQGQVVIVQFFDAEFSDVHVGHPFVF
jgi:hypothetical protein